MIGDKVIIQKQHKIKAKILMPEILARYKRGRKYIITIGGEAGTGKTEIALILRNLLYKEGIRVQLISLDNYYKTYWSERNIVREKLGIDYVGHYEIRWSMINNIIAQFKEFNNNYILRLRQINKFTDSIEYVESDKRFIDILIIEGIYSLYIEDADLNIYLEGTYNETKSFRLERAKEPQTNFRQLILKKEHQESLNFKCKADIIIDFEGKIKKK